MYEEKELDVSMKCVKYMLFVANFMFVLVGFLLISIASTIKAIYTEFDHFMSDHYFSASNLAIAVGIIIFLVALFGCIGAIKESVCLINTYAFLLLCILILEITVSIVAYATRSNLEATLRLKMTDLMNYYDDFSQYSWNATQYRLYCCGVDGPEDWDAFVGYENFPLVEVPFNPNWKMNYTVPQSCCSGEACTSSERLYTTGCLTRITLVVSECALLLGIGAMCVSFIQLLGVIFAVLLGKSVRKLKTQILVERTERRRNIYEQLANSGNNEKVTPVLYTPTSSDA